MINTDNIVWVNPLQPDTYLVHWGRSWRDGAPGVGTGNWRRGGLSGVSKKQYNVKKINGTSEKKKKKKKEQEAKTWKQKATEALKEDTAYRKAISENEKARNPQSDSSKKKTTKMLKEDSEYRKALKENRELRNKNASSANLSKAAGNFQGAASSINDISNGISKAWDRLHALKYRDEDRSQNVKELSNAELRQTIERIKLDQEYNSLTMPPKSKGYDRTMAALAVLNSAANVTATGLKIAAGVKSLRD